MGNQKVVYFSTIESTRVDGTPHVLFEFVESVNGALNEREKISFQYQWHSLINQELCPQTYSFSFTSVSLQFSKFRCLLLFHWLRIRNISHT